MRKRHISEFLKTTLANSGRAAGAGILEDDYGDESMANHSYEKQPKFEHKQRGEDGEVVVVRGGSVQEVPDAQPD